MAAITCKMCDRMLLYKTHNQRSNALHISHHRPNKCPPAPCTSHHAWGPPPGSLCRCGISRWPCKHSAAPTHPHTQTHLRARAAGYALQELRLHIEHQGDVPGQQQLLGIAAARSQGHGASCSAGCDTDTTRR